MKQCCVSWEYYSKVIKSKTATNDFECLSKIIKFSIQIKASTWPNTKSFRNTFTWFSISQSDCSQLYTRKIFGALSILFQFIFLLQFLIIAKHKVCALPGEHLLNKFLEQSLISSAQSHKQNATNHFKLERKR